MRGKRRERKGWKKVKWKEKERMEKGGSERRN
jgi:hypothetical protein